MEGPSSQTWQPLMKQNMPSGMADKISHPSDKEFHLEMLTYPKQAIATEWTDDKKPRSHKKRKATEWPLEPAPVLALKVAQGDGAVEHNVLTVCPNVFCTATLCDEQGYFMDSEIMRGRHSSSLFKLEREKSPKVVLNSPTMGVFLFDQIHIRFPGKYRLLFTLFEMQMHDGEMHAVVQNVIRSDTFTVMPQPKRLPKPETPAEILTALAAQGAKLKIRKPNEDRVKRKPDWSVNTNDPEWAAQTQMMAPPPPPLSMSMSMSMPPPMPMAMPGHGQLLQQPYQMQQQPAFLPTTMPMTAPPYPMTMPAHTQMAYQQQNLIMHTSPSHEMPQDFNFSFQDPDQMYTFQGTNPSQHGFGTGYSNF